MASSYTFTQLNPGYPELGWQPSILTLTRRQFDSLSRRNLKHRQGNCNRQQVSHTDATMCIHRRFGLHSRQLSYKLNLTIARKGSFMLHLDLCMVGFLLDISYLAILVTREFVLLFMWLESLFFFCFNDKSSLKIILTTSQRANRQVLCSFQ